MKMPEQDKPTITNGTNNKNLFELVRNAYEFNMIWAEFAQKVPVEHEQFGQAYFVKIIPEPNCYYSAAVFQREEEGKTLSLVVDGKTSKGYKTQNWNIKDIVFRHYEKFRGNVKVDITPEHKEEIETFEKGITILLGTELF
ncbi:MAG: hypothetical protein Q8O89_04405 [Nanoarchaeota archaeon]|nr:hypothetical protein [Nanoarchaeota archaeon]